MSSNSGAHFSEEKKAFVIRRVSKENLYVSILKH